MLKRRDILRGIGGAVALAAPALSRAEETADRPPLAAGLPPGAYDTAILDALPGKKPLIKLSYRPPNYETPVSYFATAFTPNDAFFVRYHLAGIPQAVDPSHWTLKVGGEGAEGAIELSIADLKNGFDQIELPAVCQCSGNRRGLSDPHVPGVQWGLGAMGNAVWKGVRLRDVLAKVGLKADAVEIVIDGADMPVVEKTPDFVKSIPVWKARDENTLIAHSMNGAPLPLLNGAPARLVVPGWTATYWMKHLVRIDAVRTPFAGFWVKSAYRIPTGKFPVIDRFLTQEAPGSTPITEIVVNSLITAPERPLHQARGTPVDLRGIAWDGGYGIARVEISSDGGESWRDATLGPDLGRFAFRPWSYRFTPTAPGVYTVLAKASNRVGQTQAESLIFNPAGYHNNVPRPVTVTVT
jgi:DMSO/TMAO reductase YedYZ molybdopterin-dependent catalytic subunit